MLSRGKATWTGLMYDFPGLCQQFSAKNMSPLFNASVQEELGGLSE